MGSSQSHTKLDAYKVKDIIGPMEVENDDIQMKPSHPEINSLPLEIWEVILKKIDDLQDIMSCSDVCYDWNLLLQNKMTSAFFQLLFSKLVRYLDKNDLLSCSAVSKDWNHWIDSSVMKFRKKSMFWRDDDERHLQLPVLTMREGKDRSDIKTFLEANNKFAGNRLAYRHVIIRDTGIIWDDPGLKFEVLCNRLEKFLQRFGSYIYKLELVSMRSVLLELTEMVYICFRHTRNLEIFKCAMLGCGYGRMGNEVEHEVDEFFATSPLPNNTLQKLRMDWVPKKLIDVLVQRYGNQLVLVDDFVNVSVNELIPRGITFRNTKVFRCNVFVTIREDTSRWNLDHITNLLRILEWTLSEVDISFSGFAYSPLSFTNFFKALTEYQPHIHTLRLASSPFQVNNRFPINYLESMDMPNLKRLTLDHMRFPPFQLLSKATPLLEYLTIYGPGNPHWIFPNHNLDEKWTTLPNCKEIRVSRRQGGTLSDNTHVFIRN